MLIYLTMKTVSLAPDKFIEFCEYAEGELIGDTKCKIDENTVIEKIGSRVIIKGDNMKILIQPDILKVNEAYGNITTIMESDKGAVFIAYNKEKRGRRSYIEANLVD